MPTDDRIRELRDAAVRAYVDTAEELEPVIERAIRTALAEQREEDARDAARLDWIAQNLFERKWNGVIDSGSSHDWYIRGDHRHTTQKLRGPFDFRAAIDAARGQK